MADPKWDDTEEISPTWDDTAEIAPQMIEEPGQLEAALRGAGQGLTFGFEDELAGGLAQLQGDDYEKARDAEREANKLAAEAHPWTYHGADIASGFALPIGAIGGFATKGASTLGKIARSAGSGAILGGLSGAGTSEGETAGDVLKDTAMGAGVGAVAGPVIEGGITGASNYLGKKGQDIGAIKDVMDFFKYGKKGVELTGPENLRTITAQGKEAVANEFIPELEQAVKLKNTMYEQGKQASEAAGKSVDIQHFESLINKAEANGADPQQIAKMRRELGILGKREEVAVTDPAEYQKMYSEKLQDESAKLKEHAYQVQMKNAEKIGQRAYKEAEKMNKDTLKLYQAELKAKYPTVDDKEIMKLAEMEMQKAGALKDPSAAAKEARDKIVSDAETMFKGPEITTEPITGENLVTAQTGENKRVMEPLKLGEDGQMSNNIIPKAAMDIEKTADKNAAYAYALAERENTKAIEKMANLNRDKNMLMSRQDAVNRLKLDGKWIDPVDAAKTAKQQTRFSQEPIDIERMFSPQLGKDVLTAKAGNEELISKILPKFNFTKEQYAKPNLDVRDVEAFRNFVGDMTGRDKQLDFRSLDQINSVGKEVRSKYNELLGQETADAALATDRQVRTSLGEMGVDSLINDSSIENKINLRDQLSKLLYKANTAKGANESVKIEEAFKGLKDIYKSNPKKLAEVESAFASVKDKMRQAYLSDITTGHNTFAIDPTSINWTMTAGGKIGMVANEAGLIINKIANAPVGKLLAQSKKFAEQGYKKYSSAFEKMSSTDDINKRRALMYTLLQDPGFRNAMSMDIMGDDNAGK